MARQRLGQHFLASPSILARIAREVCPLPEPLVVEIGPGHGALTRHLLERADRVVAVELDAALAVRLAAEDATGRLTVVHADARDADLGQWGPMVLCGNLPYYAATPMIDRLLAPGGAPPFGLIRAVFLIQLEVAQRLAAQPGSRDYGYWSAKAALSMQCDLRFRVPPGAFRPPPKVDSAVVALTPRPRAAELGIADPEDFVRFLSQCFRMKRKTLRNNLAGFADAAKLQACPPKRAEQLSLEEFVALYRVIR
ncbi:MAG: ribosomal RNA small subunit methyltransferase A [Bryobacterales bacterium]|nr:ribosomal RNA small subunit methyltransferase A [Bryobacterales bacterium]